MRFQQSSIQVSFEFKHDAATKLVQGQGRARDVTVRENEIIEDEIIDDSDDEGSPPKYELPLSQRVMLWM